jgi:hypothetical protein
VEFSYSLFLVLLLLFPGLCFWLGMRIGDRTDLATPAPERPNSTTTLFLVVLGTIVGHVVGSTFFVIQQAWCGATARCLSVSYDPNIYKALVSGVRTPDGVSDIAVDASFVGMLLIGLAAGAIGYWLARRKLVTDLTDALAFGWLNPAVQAVKAGDAFVAAYVLTKTMHGGLCVAYEGEVQHIALDDDQSVKLVVLNDVDRFLVRVSEAGLQRIDVAASVIGQLHITSDEIANIAFEIFRAPKSDVEAVDAEDEPTAKPPAAKAKKAGSPRSKAAK